MLNPPLVSNSAKAHLAKQFIDITYFWFAFIGREGFDCAPVAADTNSLAAAAPGAPAPAEVAYGVCLLKAELP